MHPRAVGPQSTLTTGARAFVLLSISAAVGWRSDVAALGGLVALSVIWVSVHVLERISVPGAALTSLEAVLVALVAGLHVSESPSLLAALAVPPFVHGLARGLRGTAEALAVQLVALGAMLLFSPLPPAPHVADLTTWLLAGLGLGLVANFFVRPHEEDRVSLAYREARSLLLELNELAAQLDGGLDPTSMGGTLLDEVAAAIPVESAVLHVERDDQLYPLAERRNAVRSSGSHDTSLDDSADAPGDSRLASAVLARGGPVVEDHQFGFLLRHGGSPIAVVTGRLPDSDSGGHEALPSMLESIAERLSPLALKLDTAQLFHAVRDRAMVEERQRLAREMHDGMAQDIASMGYVVDALLGTATPEQERALEQLRSMISRVVAEVRRSVMTLRTDAGSSESLGAAIATLARHLSESSGTPIQVTVDERTDRLRHEVESELLRIAQEAMNNGVKHANATAIDVHCRVLAPYAEIVVQDDGDGLRPGRRDSHGLSIMRERAALVGGHLEVRSTPGRGTRVSVRIGPQDLFHPADTLVQEVS